MSQTRRALVRWLKSSSNRTFVAWPLVLLAFQAALYAGWPSLNPWAVPLLVWGYAQYRWVGVMRTRQGGGGPGMSNPPQRLVTDGPYALTRNPMYLGHLIFFAGMAVLFSGVAWALFFFHVVWFDRRAQEDEAHLLQLFGAPYRDYLGRVKRWLPGIY
jgi:protein-S-isoprenylcysteine O-methyltransferase Ste14